MKVVKTKELLISIHFCGGLTILSIILGHWLPFDYFSNNNIEKHYLYLVNADLRAFIFAVPTFLIILTIFIYYIKEKPMIAMHLLGFPFMLGKDIIDGCILLLNTKNLLQPNISSFSWATWYGYRSYLHQFSIPFLLILAIILFGSNFYFWARLKESGGVKFEN